NFIQVNAFGNRSRNRVTQRNILKPQIRHIQEVARLHLHIKAGVRAAHVIRTRIESICPVFSPEITGNCLRHGAVRDIKPGNSEETATPYFSLAYTLQKHVQIKSFETRSGPEAILIARCRVSNDLQIAMIVYQPVTRVDNAIAIEIFKLHVARPEIEVS